jgi:hypothetical protein
MKNVFVLIFLSFSLLANAQTANTNLKNDKNIYYRALLEYVNYLHNNHEDTPDTIFVADDHKLNTDSILTQVGKTKLVNLNKDQLIQIFKYKEAITLYSILPLRVNNGVFSVSFVPFGVTYKRSKKHLFYSNGGGYEIDFEYIDNDFKFLKVVSHGL